MPNLSVFLASSRPTTAAGGGSALPARLLASLVVVLGASGCLGGPAGAPPPAVVAPSAVTIDTAPAAPRWYVDLPTADSLSGYLREGSGAGVLISAHRGGPAPGFPENAIETFGRTLQFGPALLEVDVRMTGDSVLVMLHDDRLDRTTTGTGELREQPFRAIRPLQLRDNGGSLTTARIPTLAEVLAWSESRAILTLDVKRGIPPVMVVGAIRRAHAENRVVVIVYNHEDLLTYHQLAPDLNISMTFNTVADIQRMMSMDVDPRRIIGFVGVGTADPTVVARLRALGIRSKIATFGDIDERAARDGAATYDDVLRRGITVIATDEPALAAEAARRANTAPGVRR